MLVSCYLRHMTDVFEALGLENDKANRKRVDLAIRDVLEMGPDAHCPEVWAAIKALTPEQRAALTGEIAARLESA